MSDRVAEAALGVLRRLVGRDDATFHDGQLEAVAALVRDRQRALVVQRTGWGKSAVYFVATALLRAQGAGPTVIVSPLLALMRDQIAAASRAGVRAVTINTANAAEWGEVYARLEADEVDLLRLEHEAFGVSNDALGAALCESWGLAAAAVASVRHHVEVQATRELPPQVQRRAICALSAMAYALMTAPETLEEVANAVAPQAQLDETLVLRGTRKVAEQLAAAAARG